MHNEIIERVRFICVKGGVPAEVMGALCHYLREALSEKQTTEPERFEGTDEFKQLASFYDVLDVAGLVRAQEERIEDMRKQLPPTPPFPGIQRVRDG